MNYPIMRVKIGKLVLDNPIICASGTFGFGFELKKLVDLKYIGAFVTKTITLKPKKGNPPPRVAEVDCGVLNSIGLENPGLDVFIKEKLPEIKKLKTKCIVSIGGENLDEYTAVIKRLKNFSEISAFEANLSCPNIKIKKMTSQSSQYTRKVTRALRNLTDKVLIVKVTGEVEDIVEIAKAVKGGGADAISLVNTFFGMAVDINTKKPYLGNIYGGYSGQGIKPLSLYRVWRVAKYVDIPIIGGGGITKTSDAIEFFLAGARAISIGTVNLTNPSSAKVILKGLKQYMKAHKINNIKDLTGGMI